MDTKHVRDGHEKASFKAQLSLTLSQQNKYCGLREPLTQFLDITGWENAHGHNVMRQSSRFPNLPLGNVVKDVQNRIVGIFAKSANVHVIYHLLCVTLDSFRLQ